MTCYFTKLTALKVIVLGMQVLLMTLLFFLSIRSLLFFMNSIKLFVSIIYLVFINISVQFSFRIFFELVSEKLITNEILYIFFVNIYSIFLTDKLYIDLTLKGYLYWTFYYRDRSCSGPTKFLVGPSIDWFLFFNWFLILCILCLNFWKEVFQTCRVFLV